MKMPILSKLNSMSFFACFMIFLMVFSIIPFWKSETAGTDIGNEIITPLFSDLDQQDIDHWCNLLDLIYEPDFEQIQTTIENSRFIGTELETQRNHNTKVYLKSDDLVTYQIYTGNIHYRDSFGNWEEFDLRINEYNHKVIGTDFVYAYGCEKNTIQSYFKDGYTKRESILTTRGDNTLGWTPEGLTYFDEFGNIYNLLEPENRIPVIKNDKILYPETYPGISELFTIKEHSLKHEIILESPTTIPVLNSGGISKHESLFGITGLLTPSSDLDLLIEGKKYSGSSGVRTKQAIEFCTNKGSDVFILPAPVAYEQIDNTDIINCEYYIEKLADNYKLSILTPYEWLMESSRTYPVVIDPTVSFKYSPEELLSNDTYIAYGNGNKINENYGDNDILLIGGNYLNDSALLKFDISSLPDKSIPFQDAILTLYTANFPGYESLELNASIHKMQQDWKEGTGTRMSPTNDGATWNGPTGSGSTWIGGPGGSYESTFVSSTSIKGPNEDHLFNIEDLVGTSTGWRVRPDTNYGLYVRYEDRELFPNSFKAFHSSKASTVSYRPKLEITFLNTPPTIKPMNKYTWNEDEDSSITIIDLDDHFEDLDHDPLNITLLTGSQWGQKIENSIFTASLKDIGNLNDPEYFCLFYLKENQFGTQVITFNATDGISSRTSDVTIEIRSINDPPILAEIGDQDAIEDEYLYVSLEVTEVENQKVFWETNVSNYNSPNYMENLFIDPDPDEPTNDKKKQLIFLPDNNNVPEVHVSIIVRDEKHTSEKPSRDWENITITVQNVNDDPILTKIEDTVILTSEEHSLSATQNKLKSLYIQAYDDDIVNGDDLTFYSDTDPADNFTITPLFGLDIPAHFRGENREVVRVDYVPNNDHVGVFEVIFGVKDLDNVKDEIKLIFNVADFNDRPIIKSHIPKDNDKFTNKQFINFSCVVDDPDFYIPESIFIEKLNVTWFINKSGRLETMGYGTSVKNKIFKAGDYNIDILVTDKRGKKTTKTFKIIIEKAITLQNKVDRNYKDNSTSDEIEYSYNTRTKKFTISQGKFAEIDLVKLYSYYEKENLVIRLRFYENLTPPVDFNIRIYLVKINHRENEPNYKVEYSASFFEKSLYKPAEIEYYGYFTEEDGQFDENNYNEFLIKYSLADLEEGVEGEFEPLKGDFEIFATVKTEQPEYVSNVRIENYRYDSIGYGSAFAPAPPSGSKKNGDEQIDNFGISLVTVVIIVIVVLILLFLMIKRRKEEKDTTVIDFSEKRIPAPGQGQPPQIPQLFMSPFEQQFKQPPNMPPMGPGGMGNMGGMGMRGPGPGFGMQQQPPQKIQQSPMPTPVHAPAPAPMPMSTQQQQPQPQQPRPLQKPPQAQ